jgi:hypothetical protein
LRVFIICTTGSFPSIMKKVIFICLVSRMECDPNQFLIRFLSFSCFKN